MNVVKKAKEALNTLVSEFETALNGREFSDRGTWGVLIALAVLGFAAAIVVNNLDALFPGPYEAKEPQNIKYTPDLFAEDGILEGFGSLG